MSILDTIKSWFRGAEDVAEGAEPPGPSDDRETSTNAQVEGAAGEPWPGNDND
jgi:hypothetical protein